jgi:hypothetical protein
METIQGMIKEELGASRLGCSIERADAASVQIRASRVTAQIAAFVISRRRFQFSGTRRSAS